MEVKNMIELIKVSIGKNEEINNNSNTENILYYDRYSRKIFDVDESGIRVYDKKAKNLKVKFEIKIPKESLIDIAIDKELKYLLCLWITNNNNKKAKNKWEKNLLLINTNKNKIDKINEDCSYLLGMFFIGKILIVIKIILMIFA